MKPLIIQLSDQQKLELRKKIKEHSDTWQIAKRLEAIRLLDTGLSVTTISQQLCVNTEIVYKYIKSFNQGGLEALITLEKPGKESQLAGEHLEAVEAYIEECRNSKVKCTPREQVRWLNDTYGIVIGEKWLYKRLLIRRHRHLDTSVHVFVIISSLFQQYFSGGLGLNHHISTAAVHLNTISSLRF